jgi:acyl CoA:acetate/3-ketoacid CoA transferase beta subunit
MCRDSFAMIRGGHMNMSVLGSARDRVLKS